MRLTFSAHITQYDVDRPHAIDPHIRIVLTSVSAPTLSALSGVPGSCEYNAVIELIVATDMNEVTERLWDLHSKQGHVNVTLSLDTGSHEL